MNTQSKNTVRRTWVAVAALSATMLAGVTQAAVASDNIPTQVVKYDDLNLKGKAGIHVLYQRIERAANLVCGNVGVRDLKGMRVKKDCVERAISDAVGAVNSQRVAWVYFAKLDSTVQPVR